MNKQFCEKNAVIGPQMFHFHVFVSEFLFLIKYFTIFSELKLTL